MRVADIYYMQMEKPDRDHTNADRAEQEYRTMIEQFPNSPLVPRAKQKLREVQEVLAERQYDVGTFYASHENWPATIARLETVADRYPLFSHSDLALIGLGDAYAAEARYAQSLNINPKAKQELMKAYDDQAADAYAKVVTQYSAAPHVEDARERLIALNRPVPEPSQQELAQSETEEQSRAAITLKDRALFLVKHGPSTVSAARVGEPTMTDTAQIIAPQINQQNRDLFTAALNDKPLPPLGETATQAGAEAAANNGAAPAAAGDSGSAPLQLESVPTASGGAAGPSIGASIVDQGEGSNSAAAPQGQTPPPASAPAGAAAPGTAQQNYGIAPVRPPNTTLPPVDKPAEAAAQINDVHGNNTAQVQTGTNAGVSKGKKKKTPAPKYDSSSESSSKHKKKTGLDKINPF
jgi:outer membrane protein assembly factor BamD